MARRPTLFYAYPSQPPALGETLTNALARANLDGQIKRAGVRFRPWPDTPVAGLRLISQITDQIDRADVFAADLTYVNPNVAFELGYAVAREKRLWLTLDRTIDQAVADYKHQYTGMLGAGFLGYENHVELADALVREKPWASSGSPLLGEAYRRRQTPSELPTLLHLKPLAQTSAVIASAEALLASPFAESLIVDDPRENAAPTLEWYAAKIQQSDAVLIHLLGVKHRLANEHNAKASFVAGLAHGLGKQMLMLAHAPFECPTDYETLLKTHETAEQCQSLLSQWLDELAIPRRRDRRPDEAARLAARDLELRNLFIGEPVAENEDIRLDDYFVETSSFFSALDAQSALFVGRRGTGKTATFLALQSEFRQDARNHVCAIKPVGYEVDGLIRLLTEEWRSAERGFLVESLWKFLIYSELAGSVASEIRNRPVHQLPSDAEHDLLGYVEMYSDVLQVPFSQRLTRAVAALEGTGALQDTEEQRARISEFLHAKHLGPLRVRLGRVLTRRAKVAILIDNLDEPWRPNADTRALSELLLGLLREIQDLADDFRHGDSRQDSVNVSLLTFLRSDIFAYIHPLASEQDKWPLHRIQWNDDEALLRVVNQRFLYGVPSRYTSDEVWASLFPQSVVGLSPQEFVLRNTLSRPRDVIFMVKESVSVAVNRGHKTVFAEDMLSARERYSRFVFNSVLSEDDPEKQFLQDILYQFSGVGHIIPLSEVEARILSAGVSENDLQFYVSLLCDINFLGIQTGDETFVFASDENERQMRVEVAFRLANERGRSEPAFQINAAFFQLLQIEP